VGILICEKVGKVIFHSHAESEPPVPEWFGAAFDQNTMAVFNRQPDLKLITFFKIGTRHAG